MTYIAPTLLLIGAAQSIVLEGIGPSGDIQCRPDNVLWLESDAPELW
jgi:hypothetical protein